MESLVPELPAWLTLEFVLRVVDSKIFSAISWVASAIVAIIGLIAKIKYRRANLKKLLDAYIRQAIEGEGRERNSVKEVIKRATDKARGLANKKPFDPSKVFEEAARLFAQSQPEEAVRVLTREAEVCESTIDYARHHVRLSQERAATAYLEIGLIQRHRGRGVDAIQAFMSMLRVNPGDLDALRMLGIQYRDMGLYTDAEQNFNALEYHVRGSPAAEADAKRELGAVFLGSRAFSRAEAVLSEALEIEKRIPSQAGIALTHESIGVVLTARKRWAGAKRSYDASRLIFESLGDTEDLARVRTHTKNMETAREEALRQRREKQRQQAPLLLVAAVPPAPLVVH